MSRNPKMKKLRSRLTPAQLEARANDIEAKSMWRQQMAMRMAKLTGAINACSAGIEMVYKAHKITRYLVYGAFAGQALYIAGRLLGYWS